MEQEKMLEDVAQIMAGIGKSKMFWEMQQCMRGERILLSYLYETGGSSTPGQLASLLNVSAARITNILTRLECKGLIRRRADPQDRRRIHVELTDKGAGMVADVHAQVTAHALDLFDKLGEDDTLTFLRILKKMLSYEEMVEVSTQSV